MSSVLQPRGRHSIERRARRTHDDEPVSIRHISNLFCGVLLSFFAPQLFRSKLNRDSPVEFQTGVNIRAFSAFLQDRCEMRTATDTSYSQNGGELLAISGSSGWRISDLHCYGPISPA